MNFESFIRLAEKNQAKHDRKAEKIQQEEKKKKDLLKQELAAARELWIAEQKKLATARFTNVGEKVSSKNLEKNPLKRTNSQTEKQNSNSLTYIPTKEKAITTVVAPEEYVPEVPKKAKQLSSLMAVLDAMKNDARVSENSDGKSSSNIYKIPKIPRKLSKDPEVNNLESSRQGQSKSTNSVSRSSEKGACVPVSPMLNSKVDPKSLSMKLNNLNHPNSTDPPKVKHSINSAKSGPVNQAISISTHRSTEATLRTLPRSIPVERKVLPKEKPKLIESHKRSVNDALKSLSCSKTQHALPASKKTVNAKSKVGIAAQFGRSQIVAGFKLQHPASVKEKQRPSNPSGIAAQLSSEVVRTFDQRPPANFGLTKNSGLLVKSSKPKELRPIDARQKTYSVDKSKVNKMTSSSQILKPTLRLPSGHNRSLDLDNIEKYKSVDMGRQTAGVKGASRSVEFPMKVVPALQPRGIATQQPGGVGPQQLRGISAQQPRGIGAQQPRGIAAQFGSVILGRPDARSPDDYSCDESDEYTSDDSFIDDSESHSAKDYSKYVREIHKSLNFDPKKYASVSRYDDLSQMESNYRQIEKEEKISARLGAKEDEADMAAEARRKQRRLQKLAAVS